MKINFEQSLSTLEGAPLERPSLTCPECGQITKAMAVTLRSLCTEALTVQSPEQVLSTKPEDKIKQYHLALRIANEDVVNVSPEELVLLRDLIGRSYGNLIVGQALAMLDSQE